MLEYDSRLKTKKVDINVGNKVYIKRCRPKLHKLETPFVGPFRVEEVHNDRIKAKYISTGKSYTVHKSIVLVTVEQCLSPSDNANVEAVFPCEYIVDEDTLIDMLTE